MSTQFNPYAAAQSPYPLPQSGFPPQQSPYGGGFPPQMPTDAFGPPGMGAPTGLGGGIRPYESGGIADDSNGDLSSGSEGGLLSKIFSLKGLLTIGGIGAAALVIKHFLGGGGETQQKQPSEVSLNHEALKTAYESLGTASPTSKASVHGNITKHLKALNKALPPKPTDSSPDPLTSAQRKALEDLNEAYGYNNYDNPAEEFNAAEQLKDLTEEDAGEITKAHAKFEEAFADYNPQSDGSSNHSDHGDE